MTHTDDAHAYILGEGQGETERLVEQARRDPALQRALRAGLRAGMTVVDAGCGPGGVARALAQAAGPGGRVYAFDLSEERLAAARQQPPADGAAPIEFLQGDVRSPPLPEGIADLVYCQYVLEYLPDPPRAIAALRRLLKPGGRLVLVDVDGIGLGTWPMPEVVERHAGRLLQVLARTGFDAHVGRKLYAWMRAEGLTDIRAHLEPYTLFPGRADDTEQAAWRQRFEAIRPLAVEAFDDAAQYDAFVSGYLDMLADPGSFKFSLVFTLEGTAG